MAAIKQFKDTYDTKLKTAIFLTSSSWSRVLKITFPRASVKLLFHESCQLIVVECKEKKFIGYENNDKDFRTMVNIATIALLHKDNIVQGIIRVNEILKKTPNLELRFRTIMNSAKNDYLAQMIDVSCYDDIECCYTTSFLNVKDLNNIHSKKGPKKKYKPLEILS